MRKIALYNSTLAKSADTSLSLRLPRHLSFAFTLLSHFPPLTSTSLQPLPSPIPTPIPLPPRYATSGLPTFKLLLCNSLVTRMLFKLCPSSRSPNPSLPLELPLILLCEGSSSLHRLRS